MTIHRPHKTHRSQRDDPDDPDPGLMPVEPDQGLVPTHIPDDPEHDRLVDPEAG